MVYVCKKPGNCYIWSTRYDFKSKDWLFSCGLKTRALMYINKKSSRNTLGNDSIIGLGVCMVMTWNGVVIDLDVLALAY